MRSPLKLVRTYAGFVKLAHTVFALPFAVAGLVAAYAVPFDYVNPRPGHSLVLEWAPRYLPVDWRVVALILVCMVSARSFAMAMNRIVDRRIDALNPRTAARELPSGALSLAAATAFALVMAVVYVGACYLLGPVVLWLSPIPILLMTLYPYTKRFTWLCHVVLGICLGLAPVGAWVAVRTFNVPDGAWDYVGWEALTHAGPWLLGGAVALWVAGFDIIYALQDDEFDRANKLHSIPARFGRRRALWISRALHAVSSALFFAFAWAIMREGAALAAWAWAAPAVMLIGMVYQHTLVKAHDLTRVNLAFFTVNGLISVAFGVAFLAAWLIA